MRRLLIPLAAAVALAAPVAAADAKKRPEHTACTLSGVPKQMPMEKALRKGIPATYTCHVAASPLVTVMWWDNNVRVSAEERNASIAHSHGAPPIPEVPAGTTKSIRLKILPGDRKIVRRYARVRLLVDIAASLSGEMGPFYSASEYGKRITLLR
jgi:hypothetical protein